MPRPPLPSTPRRPWPRLLTIAGGVLLLHAVLWQGVADSFAASDAAERAPPAVQVRTLPLAAPAEAPPTVKPAIVAKPAPAPRRAVLVKPAAEPVPVSETPPQPAAEPETPLLLAAALPAKPASQAAAVAAGQDEIPVYRTVMPPPMTLSYVMRRGGFTGTGELQWRPTASAYEARFQGSVAGFNLITWVSQGGFDAAGIAPVRYTDQRRGKSAQAANFQREAGKISFSGSSNEFPLLQGSQDRLTWMIQIAAIASADAQRLAPGARLVMYVAGARGDAEAWSFQVQATESVRTPQGNVSAIRLLREPRQPHDTRVEVWLAPSLHHLPVRARLTNDDSTFDLQLQEAKPAS